ncbi:adenosylhomocysteinase [Microbacterium indicum]|uniref:adenosylhomocysteinase n=1 Tax=Microbacterium indicum TaxID=358100 RepID=UPI0004022E5E|nr:adenosylhomocysteinase [Microbacterium indicum]
MDETRDAEAILRRVARDTNLLFAARPASVARGTSHEPVAARVDAMLRALGSLADAEGAPGSLTFAFDRLAPGTDPTGVPVLLDGRPLPDRGDAAGRIAFAAERMPVSAAIAAETDLAGLRVGVSMVLEPKTANLALLLRRAGAAVSVYAHPDETDAAVADALRVEGIPTTADPALSGASERAAAESFLRAGFDVLIDDGAHLIRLAHEIDPAIPGAWIGANEETTSGLTPLRRMAEAGLLRTPVMAVNDAAVKKRFDNRYGTGQSCALAIGDLLERAGGSVRDQPAVVVGYGPVGQGVAACLAALGAAVRVAETDPVRALEATHDGHGVAPLADAARGALVVSATGAPGTIPAAIAERAAAVAVAGGIPGEVDEIPGPRTVVAPGVERLASGALLLGGGGAVNLTAGEGNPIEIMDLSFAAQLTALAQLLRERPGPGVHAVSPEADDRVARAALAARGLRIDRGSASAAPGSVDWRSPRYPSGRRA